MRLFTLFAIGLLSTTTAFSQDKPAPNTIDLKANYCVAVVQDSADALEAMQHDPKQPYQSDREKKLAQAMSMGLEHAQADLRRLRLYLAPRLKVVQLEPMAEQKHRAERDIASAKQAKSSCVEQCPVEAADVGEAAQKRRTVCLSTCYSKISIAAELKACRPTDWLPN